MSSYYDSLRCSEANLFAAPSEEVANDESSQPSFPTFPVEENTRPVSVYKRLFTQIKDHFYSKDITLPVSYKDLNENADTLIELSLEEEINVPYEEFCSWPEDRQQIYLKDKKDFANLMQDYEDALMNPMIMPTANSLPPPITAPPPPPIPRRPSSVRSPAEEVILHDMNKLNWQPPVDPEEDEQEFFEPFEDPGMMREAYKLAAQMQPLNRIEIPVEEVVATPEEISAFQKVTDYVESKILNSDFLSHMDIPSIDTVYEWLAELKPINLGCFYFDIVNSKSVEERTIVVLRMCEMYNIFWTSELKVFETIFVNLIVEAVYMFFGKENNEFVHQSGTFQKNDEANEWLETFLLKFNIILPDGMQDTVVKILGFVLGIFLIITGGKFFDFSMNFDQIIKRVKKAATIVKSTKTLFNDLPEVFATLLNEVANLFGYSYYTKADKEVTQFREDLLKFKTEIFELHQILKTKPAAILLDQARIIKMNTSMQQMDALYDRLLKQKVNSAVCKPLLDEIRPVLTSINEYVMNSKEESCTKIEPFMCVLTGAAGIGKSQLVNALSRSVTNKIKQKYPELAQLKPSIFMRNSKDKYWSGYTGETYVGYDDFGQTKTDEDHADIMQVKNPNRTILNMAALPDKGRCFTSLGIFACANQVSVSSSAVVKSLAALGRRFEIHVYCMDPNFDRFKQDNGCSPGNFEKKTRTKAMVRDVHGNLIPYFDPINFEHLNLFTCPGDEPRTVENTQRVSFEDLAQECFNFFDHYYESYLSSQIPTVPAEIQAAYQRVSSDVDYVVNNQHQEIVNDVVKGINTKRAVEAKVRQFVGGRETGARPKLRSTNPFAPQPSTSAEPDPFPNQRTAVFEQPKDRKRPKAKKEALPSLDQCRAHLEALKAQPPPPIENPFVDLEPKVTEASMKFVGNFGVFENTKVEQPAFEQFLFQAKEEVESSAHAFVDYEQKRGKTFMLSGDPGAGKSTLAKKIIATVGPAMCSVVSAYDLKNLTVTTPALYIEDATVSQDAWLETEKLIMKHEDGHNPFQVLIVSINPKVMFQWFSEDSDNWKRVARRCKIFNFHFSPKVRGWFSNVMYTAEDLRRGDVPFAKAVDLTHGGITVSEGDVRAEITEAITSIDMGKFTAVICNSVPYMTREMYTPNFVVEFKTPMYESFKILYDDPKKMLNMILKGEVKMHKGNPLEGYKIAKQFQSNGGGKPAFPESLHKFIVMINNSNFRSDIDFITEIICPDKSVVIMPKKDQPKVISCFLVCERLRLSDGVFTDGEFEAVPNVATSRLYSEYLENAETLAAQIETASEQLEEKATNTIGHLTLASESDWFSKILKISIFCLKVTGAFLAVSAYSKRYTPVHVHERSAAKRLACKKKNKARKAFRALRQMSHFEYDELRDTFNEKANTAARKRGMIQVANEYGDSLFDDAGYVTEEFEHFLMYYEAQTPNNNYKMYCESMEKLKDKDNPKVEVDETMLIESTIIPPSVTIEEEVLLERKFTLPTAVKEKAVKDLTTKVEQNAIFVNEMALDAGVRPLVSVVKKNHVRLGLVRAGAFELVVHGLMVGEKYGVTVLHATSEPLLAEFYSNGSLKTYPIRVVRKFVNNDLAVFRIDDPSCPFFKNIISHFPPRSYDMKKKFHNTFGVMVTVDEQGDALMRSVNITAVEKIVAMHPITRVASNLELLEYSGYITGLKTASPILTVAGDCGSPIIANDVTIQHKIMGIHSAATTTQGASAMVCREHLKDLEGLSFTYQQKINKMGVSPPHHKIEYRKKTNEFLLGMPVVATIEQNRHMPTKTKLWTSPIALPDSSLYEPSILSENDPRNMSSKHPYYESIAKWNHPQPDVDEEKVIEIMQDLGDWYAKKIITRNLKTKILTKTEAINSGKNYAIVQLNRDASPGYPWINHEKKVKDFLIDKGTGNEAYYGIDLNKRSGQILNSSIDSLIDICRDVHTFPYIPFLGTLKDEPLKLKKIYSVDPENVEAMKEKYGEKWQGAFAPNTRSFAGAPIDYTIVSRMYFGTIIGAMNSVRDEAPVQIGIDAGSLEWDTMINDLMSCSSIGVDTDFKGWDSTVPSLFKKHLHHFYNTIAQQTDDDWKPEDDIIRENLVQCEVKPKIMVIMPDKKIHIVQAPGGEPSGSPRTAPDNSILHAAMHIYNSYSILDQVGLKDLCSVSAVMKMLKLKCYGDDGLFAIHPSLVGYFNFSKMAAEYKKLGMECTPAAKGDKIIEYQEITDLEFLKRKTKKIGKYYFGALLENSIEKMLSYCKGPSHNWYREPNKIKYVPEDVVATAQSALHEAVLHGKDYYNNLLAHFYRKFRDYNISGELLSFKDQVLTRRLPIPRN